MTSIYVANTTKQNWEFQFRVPENPKLMVATIAVGQATGIYKPDMSSIEADAIIRQLQGIGAVEEAAVDRARDFIGLCYRVDKPVREDRVLSALKHNDEVLEERGHEMRKEAAVAINSKLDEIPGGLASTTVEVVEQPRRGESGEGLKETIVVEREGGDTPKHRRGRKAK